MTTPTTASDTTPRGRADDDGDGDGHTESGRRRKHQPGFELDCGTGPEVRHVGVAFVHGIGNQAAGETLLDWGGAIIGLLLDIRVAQKTTGDPVIACELDPGPGKSRYIELQLPAAIAKDGTKIPEQHWVMTEAWWAQRVRPPAFGQMAEWLGPRGAIRRILLAMLPLSREEHDPRRRPLAEGYPLRRRGGRVEESAELGHVVGEENAKHSNFETFIGSVGRVSAGLYLQAISALILVIYGALRSIEKVLPIGPLKNGALTRPIDEFMLNWFGDVFVLLSDPAQAASVRGRLVDALHDLKSAKCDQIVVVAHSGGAIVSYMTIADPANRRLQVDRIITLGEGLNLAWLLSGGDKTDERKIDESIRRRYERLYSDIFKGREKLSWHDFWASQDPAPVGVLKVPEIGSVEDGELSRITSHGVWNRLAFAEDHGTYWENDEEFLLPMVRLLDGSPNASRFFGDKSKDDARSNRRRRRLTLLSLWRQLSLVGPTAAVVVAFCLGTGFIWRASDAVATVWDAIPGSGLISEPINTLRDLNIETSPIGGFVAETGVWVIAAIIGLAAIFALIAPPERPVPWGQGGHTWVNPVLRVLPWVIGFAVGVAVVYGAIRFALEATAIGANVGRIVGLAFVGILSFAGLAVAVFGSPFSMEGNRSWATMRDLFEMVFTILIMTLAVFLAISPFVSIAAFENVGRTVLGTLSVVVAFQILGRIGAWRWNVWDGRERVAARTEKPYPRLRRVFIQMGLLFATFVFLFVAVLADSGTLVAIAAAGAGLAVLLGISVDVFDASRQERTSPNDRLRASSLMSK